MKLMIWVGITVGSLIGSWLGAALTGGNWFSGLSIFLGFIGCFVGLWAGFKIGQTYFD